MLYTFKPFSWYFYIRFFFKVKRKEKVYGGHFEFHIWVFGFYYRVLQAERERKPPSTDEENVVSLDAKYPEHWQPRREQEAKRAKLRSKINKMKNINGILYTNIERLRRKHSKRKNQYLKRIYHGLQRNDPLWEKAKLLTSCRGENSRLLSGRRTIPYCPFFVRSQMCHTWTHVFYDKKFKLLTEALKLISEPFKIS